MLEYNVVENARTYMQSAIDVTKSRAERNKLGQFSTPQELAKKIVKLSLRFLPSDQNIRFLDPAVGTGSFFSALLINDKNKRVEIATGYEIDPRYGVESQKIWNKENYYVFIADFTRLISTGESYNLVVCNPPYVRHHHIDLIEKKRLKEEIYNSTGIKMNGLAGLYCYFMLLSYKWMADNAVGAWLVPSEFMDVNYGKEVKEFLINKVKLLHIHRFNPDEVKFEDALVSSSVIWFQKAKPNKEDKIKFTFGNDVLNPSTISHITNYDLSIEQRWTRIPNNIRTKSENSKISDFFTIKRGIATGDNKFFILSLNQILTLKLPFECFRPILPSPRNLKKSVIESDTNGFPVGIEQLFLLDCRMTEMEIKKNHPALWDYLQSGAEQVSNRYLCRTRNSWYYQENREPSPFLCTYLGRANSTGRTFRFVLNNSKAISTNVYLMLYPKAKLLSLIEENKLSYKDVWNKLNEIKFEDIKNERRIYGGGLEKLEPSELSNVPFDVDQ